MKIKKKKLKFNLTLLLGKRCWLLCVDRGLWYKVLAICMGSTRGRLGEAVSRRRYGGGSWVILGRVLLLYEGRRAGLFNVWGIVHGMVKVHRFEAIHSLRAVFTIKV